jgi:hypothetical protein
VRVKKLLLLGLILAAIVQLAQYREFFGTKATDTASSQAAPTRGDDILGRAFEQQRSNVQVTSSGVVVKVLPDDEQGSRHQRFLVRVESGQTVLIAHNIDLAARLESLKAGDHVEFSGEYEWNNKGGVIHWTHRDPAGRHVAGWVRKTE